MRLTHMASIIIGVRKHRGAAMRSRSPPAEPSEVTLRAPAPVANWTFIVEATEPMRSMPPPGSISRVPVPVIGPSSVIGSRLTAPSTVPSMVIEVSGLMTGVAASGMEPRPKK